MFAITNNIEIPDIQRKTYVAALLTFNQNAITSITKLDLRSELHWFGSRRRRVRKLSLAICDILERRGEGGGEGEGVGGRRIGGAVMKIAKISVTLHVNNP